MAWLAVDFFRLKISFRSIFGGGVPPRKINNLFALADVILTHTQLQCGVFFFHVNVHTTKVHTLN